MEKYIRENDFEQVTFICNKCGDEMKFSSTDEEGDMFFLQYMCEKCENVVWVLDNEKRYLKDLERYLFGHNNTRDKIKVCR